MKLAPRHYKAIGLLCYSDMTQKEIAAEIGVNPHSITEWLKNEDFKAELDKEVRNKFLKLAVDAQKRLEKLIYSKVDSVSLNAVKEVLSKAGYDAVQKVENTNTNITVSIDEGE